LENKKKLSKNGFECSLKRQKGVQAYTKKSYSYYFLKKALFPIAFKMVFSLPFFLPSKY